MQAGHVFQRGHRAQQPPLRVAHGRGAQAVAAFLLANAHGQHGRFALGGHCLLHLDGIADGAQNLVASGRVGQRHAVGGGFAQQLGCGLVHLEHVALAVGHNDGLKDGLQHRVGELKLHLPASSLRVPQLAQPYRDPVQFGGDHAKVVVAAPLHPVLQVSLGDSVRIAGQHVNRPQNKIDGAQFNQQCGNDEDVRQCGLPRCRQGAVRNSHQSHREAG